MSFPYREEASPDLVSPVLEAGLQPAPDAASEVQASRTSIAPRRGQALPDYPHLDRNVAFGPVADAVLVIRTRRGGGHRRVEGIATLKKEPQTGLRGQGMGCRHYPPQ